MPLSGIYPMTYVLLVLASLSWTVSVASGAEASANRLSYLDAPIDPYYVGLHFPRLVTPQWVGDTQVDAVVVLAIDDMRDTAHYEAFLRPILDQLEQHQGAEVAIVEHGSLERSDLHTGAESHCGPDKQIDHNEPGHSQSEDPYRQLVGLL